MTGQTRVPGRVERPENRLNRVERILEQMAEREIHAEYRQNRTQAQLDALLKPGTVRKIESLFQEKRQPAMTVPLYEFA